jgi:hypothetical protein
MCTRSLLGIALLLVPFIALGDHWGRQMHKRTGERGGVMSQVVGTPHHRSPGPGAYSHLPL